LIGGDCIELSEAARIMGRFDGGGFPRFDGGFPFDAGFRFDGGFSLSIPEPRACN
jgi:hypothetical protein